MTRRIGASHKLGLLCASLFYSLPHPCFDLGVRNPFVTRAFADILNNRIGYGRVLPRFLRTLPLFLLTEAAAGLGGLIGGPNFRIRLRNAVYSF